MKSAADNADSFLFFKFYNCLENHKFYYLLWMVLAKTQSSFGLPTYIYLKQITKRNKKFQFLNEIKRVKNQIKEKGETIINYTAHSVFCVNCCDSLVQSSRV